MSLLPDEDAASPLAVLSVFVLVAAGVTALAFFLFFDPTDAAIVVEPAADGFRVASVTGSFDWSGLRVEFLDAAGEDRAGLYLALPDGRVETGQSIALRHQVPAGTYLLRVVEDGTELTRLVARV